MSEKEKSNVAEEPTTDKVVENEVVDENMDKSIDSTNIETKDDDVSENALSKAIERIYEAAKVAEANDAMELLNDIVNNSSVKDVVDVSPFIKSFMDKFIPIMENLDKEIKQIKKSISDMSVVSAANVQKMEEFGKSFNGIKEDVEVIKKQPEMRKSVATAEQASFVDRPMETDGQAKELTAKEVDDYNKKCFALMSKGIKTIANGKYNVEAILFNANKKMFSPDQCNAFPDYIREAIDKELK